MSTKLPSALETARSPLGSKFSIGHLWCPDPEIAHPAKGLAPLGAVSDCPPLSYTSSAAHAATALSPLAAATASPPRRSRWCRR